MTGETFEGLLKWVQDKESRTMDINVGRLHSGIRDVTAFVFDYEMNMGQRVKHVDEIDLQKEKKSLILELKKALGD